MITLTQNMIQQIFKYEPETGMLRKVLNARKPYPWRGAGKNRRYLITNIGGKEYYLHRLVWLYHHGVLPTLIDHINGNPRDNRIENLRECTYAENQYNAPRKSNNKSGVKGVVFCTSSPRKPWHAKITINKRRVSLGYFAEIDDAARAYQAALKKNAGKFARDN